jgi:hypothetical protein
MIVTPVAKQPIALRNSEEFKLTVRPLLQRKLFSIAFGWRSAFSAATHACGNQSGFSRRGSAALQVPATAYITMPRRCIIRFT